MSIEVIQTCPLNSVCEEVKDNKIYRCRLFVELKGQDSEGEEHNKRDCAWAWEPLLLIEQSQQTRDVGASMDSLRNAHIKRQDTALQSMRLIKDLEVLGDASSKLNS